MQKRIAIIGAGISGLSLAWNLSRALHSAECTLAVFEANDRPGGMVWTQQIDGWLVEFGPNGFLDSVPSTAELCRQLGLSDALWIANPLSARRFLCRANRLVELPTSPMRLLRSPLFSWRGKLRLALERVVPRATHWEGETIAAFTRRRFGAEAVELVDAITTGIFAGDSEALSVAACFPRLVAMERESGSILSALNRARKTGGARPGKLRAPRAGMGEIIKRLAEELGDIVRLNTRVQSVRRRDQGGFVVDLAKDESVECEVVVLAVPPSSQARLLRDMDSELAREVAMTETVPAVVATIGMRRSDVGAEANAYGFLTSRSATTTALGVIFSSSIFDDRAPADGFQFRAILGGHRQPEVLDWSDQHIVDAVCRDLRELLQISAKPIFTHICRWPAAIPQYDLGWLGRQRRIERLVSGHSGLFLAGNGMSGVAVNDCTAQALKIANQIGAHLSQAQ